MSFGVNSFMESAMELKFNEIFKPSLLAMKANRSDPAIKKDLKWFILFLLVHGAYTMIFLLIVYNIIYVNLKENQFTDTCKNCILAVVYNAITFQYIVMIWNQKKLKLLINTVKRDYLLTKSLSVTEQEIVHKFAMQGNHVCNQWFIMAAAGASLFPIKNIFLISLGWVNNEEIELIPLFNIVFPSFMGSINENIIVYGATYQAMLAYDIYSALMYCAFVPLGPIFILHACGQLEVIKNRIDNLFNTDDLDQIRLNLKGIVKQLQYIYDFVDIIQTCFTVAYEITLKITTILLPITCFAVLESLKHGDISLEFLVFIVGGVLFSSSPCFYGDLLMEKGEDVRLAVYSCGWERMYDRGIRSTVRIILQRALRPVAIRTLFNTVCLVTLTELFHQSYTIFNLMNAAWN